MNNRLTPLVSVVIPTYNHARYLSRALQSVLEQTFINWEAIVIDNHSTDNTDEVMADYTDPRITYLKIHNNGVIAASRNAGIQAAKGEWVAFLDSDDWWTTDKLQVCFDCIRPEVDIIYHDLLIERERKSFFREKKILESRQMQSPALMDLLVNGNLLANSSVVIRKRLLNQVGGIDENPEMIASEDYNTWLRIAEISEGFLYINRVLGFYMIHQQGISNRDMTLPWKCAVSNFIHLFSKDERNAFDCITAYESGKYSYIHYDYESAIKNFNFCIKNARLNIRTKAVFRLIFSHMSVYKYILTMGNTFHSKRKK